MGEGEKERPQSGKLPTEPGDGPAHSFQKELTGPLTLPRASIPAAS